MDAHLIGIPCLTSFTTRCLSRSNLQALRRQAYGTFDSEILRLCALNELLADLLEGLDFFRGEGNCGGQLIFSWSPEDWEIHYGSCGFSGHIAVSMVFKLELSEWKRTGPSPKSFSGF